MLTVIAVIAFVVGYIIPACIEFYERTRSADDDESRVSPFSVRSGWFTAFSALTVGAASFLIYRWSDGKIWMLDRELATAFVLAASVSVIIAFAILKWLEGVITVLGYMWDNTVVARRKRIAAQEKAEAEARAKAEAETQAKDKAEKESIIQEIEKSLSHDIEESIARGIEEGIARGMERSIALSIEQGRAEGRAEREAEVESSEGAHRRTGAKPKRRRWVSACRA